MSYYYIALKITACVHCVYVSSTNSCTYCIPTRRFTMYIYPAVGFCTENTEQCHNKPLRRFIDQLVTIYKSVKHDTYHVLVTNVARAQYTAGTYPPTHPYLFEIINKYTYKF